MSLTVSTSNVFTQNTMLVSQPTALTSGLSSHYELAYVMDAFEDKEFRIRDVIRSCTIDVDSTNKWVREFREKPLAYVESVTFQKATQDSIVYEIELQRLKDNNLKVVLRFSPCESDLSKEREPWSTCVQRRQFTALKDFLKPFGASNANSCMWLNSGFVISENENAIKFIKQLVSFGCLADFVLDLIQVPSFRDYLENTQPKEIIRRTPSEVWFNSKHMNFRLEGCRKTDLMYLWFREMEGNKNVPGKLELQNEHIFVDDLIKKPKISSKSYMALNAHKITDKLCSPAISTVKKVVTQTLPSTDKTNASAKPKGISITISSDDYFNLDHKHAPQKNAATAASQGTNRDDDGSNDDWEMI